MQSIRDQLRALPRHTHARHAISENIKVFRDRLLLERPQRGKRDRQIVDLSKSGNQLAIPDIVDVFSERVLRSSSGQMLAIFPWRHWRTDQASMPVQVDPEVMSGRLVITGTRIPVRMVYDRVRRGQTAAAIADDYGLSEDNINKALLHLDKKAAVNSASSFSTIAWIQTRRSQYCRLRDLLLNASRTIFPTKESQAGANRTLKTPG